MNTREDSQGAAPASVATNSRLPSPSKRDEIMNERALHKSEGVAEGAVEAAARHLGW